MSNAGKEGTVPRETFRVARIDVDRWLRSRGVSEREITAEGSRVDTRVIDALHKTVPETLRLMAAGEIPRSGFGLGGEAGRGKTFAMVALIRRFVAARWPAFAHTPGAGRWLEWRRWPEFAAEMRTTATMEGGYAAAEHDAGRLSRAPALVLDDLGAERMRGDGYEGDWIATMLDLLIDRRYNAMKPTWYTTNLTVRELRERYGARMYSRLCSENRLVWIPSGPDLRVVGDARAQ